MKDARLNETENKSEVPLALTQNVMMTRYLKQVPFLFFKITVQLRHTKIMYYIKNSADRSSRAV
jgi:hypothetical protein